MAKAKGARIRTKKISLSELKDVIDKPWSPVDVAFFNDSVIRMVRMEGDFLWHKHDNSDEVFMVCEGQFTLQTNKRTFLLKKGECIVVPRRVFHRPRTDSSAIVLLLESKNTKQYGE